MNHRSKGSNSGSRADKKKVFFQRMRKGKRTLRPTQYEFIANLYFFKKIFGACSSFQKNDHQFEDRAAIGPGSDGITAPAFGRLLMNGKIQCHELSRFKMKGLSGNEFNPKPARKCRCIFNAYDFSGLPGL